MTLRFASWIAGGISRRDSAAADNRATDAGLDPSMRLELWDKGMSSVQGQVSPKGNRMLVFTTSEDSYHGHPDPLVCPEDVARRSMALYYFTEEERAVRRSTDYRARPQDGVKRVAIWADKNVVDLYDRAKRRLRLDDDTAQRILARIDGVRRRK